jgi:homocysteine S-methyltransferase
MKSSTENPIAGFVKRQGIIVLDGGLATALEARGYHLDDELWSAKILLEAPDAIRQVHLDFLAAGADCITTASYQATLSGFRARGVSEGEGVELLHRSIGLAVEARDMFWKERGNRRGRLRPLVAASIGPYGAFLADGSEYTGRYGIDDDGLRAFH